MLNVPILLIVFNRPDLTRRVFGRIRDARPSKLFVAADGPRLNIPSDAELCVKTRNIIDLVDWDCEVQTLFRKTNLGCKRAVSSAIDWFFEQVEAGIILEDDCLAESTFFPFCAELLEYYHDDERIMIISGDNFQQGRRRTPYSYYFSCYNHVWGWASWRRVWRYYDVEMKSWPELRNTSLIFDILNDDSASIHRRNIFDKTYSGAIDTWDYQLTLASWAKSSLAVLPEINLVSNIGFGEGATHTSKAVSSLANLPTAEMRFPLRHPPHVVRNLEADNFTTEIMYKSVFTSKISLLRRIVRKLGIKPLRLKSFFKHGHTE